MLTLLAAVNKTLSRSGYSIVATGLQKCLSNPDGLGDMDAKNMEKLFLSLS